MYIQRNIKKHPVHEIDSDIIKAIKEYGAKIKEQGICVYVRRGGPNYERGLKSIKEACDEVGARVEVYGPETHMTEIVSRSLA